MTKILTFMIVILLGQLSGCSSETTSPAAANAIFDASPITVEREILFIADGPGINNHSEAIMFYTNNGASSVFRFWLTDSHHRGYDLWVLKRNALNEKVVNSWSAHSTQTGASEKIESKPTAIDSQWLAKLRAVAWAHEPVLKTDRKRITWKGRNIPIESFEFSALQQTVDSRTKLPERYEARDKFGTITQLVQVNKISKIENLWLPVRIGFRDFQNDQIVRIEISDVRRLKKTSATSFKEIVESRKALESKKGKQLNTPALKLESLSAL